MKNKITDLLHKGWPINTIHSHLSKYEVKKTDIIKIAKELQILSITNENSLVPKYPWGGVRHQNGLKPTYNMLYHK